jgi:hypothetical protein
MLSTEARIPTWQIGLKTAGCEKTLFGRLSPAQITIRISTKLSRRTQIPEYVLEGCLAAVAQH